MKNFLSIIINKFQTKVINNSIYIKSVDRILCTYSMLNLHFSPRLGFDFSLFRGLLSLLGKFAGRVTLLIGSAPSSHRRLKFQQNFKGHSATAPFLCTQAGRYITFQWFIVVKHFYAKLNRNTNSSNGIGTELHRMQISLSTVPLCRLLPTVSSGKKTLPPNRSLSGIP